MTRAPRRPLGALLVQSMAEAAAIQAGRLEPARRDRLSVRQAEVIPPPRFRAARIRRLRERLGLSQAVFAKALNVSAATVRSWEQGARTPEGSSCRLLEVAERYPEVILAQVHSAA